MPAAKILTERNGKFTRAQGASSGSETYAIGSFLMALSCYMLELSYLQCLYFCAASFTFQLVAMSKFERDMSWYYCFSLKFGPAKVRNAVISFAECVKPGGKPTSDHCLNMYHFSPLTTCVMFSMACVWLLTISPFCAFVRIFYPEHYYGVNSGRYFQLFYFFLRHPLAIQGEGPSNGDGLASLNASETLIFPMTPLDLTRGPTDHDYWLTADFARPRFRDMFHDKMFVHRFFKSFNAPCPILVAEVEGHETQQMLVDEKQAPKKLIWKPRYSTMGLGVEHFTGWGNKNTKNWAPSTDPYIVEELIVSTEWGKAEWYRMTTLFDYDEDTPKNGYIWRMRNNKDDHRVQTDILGGAYCINTKWPTFVGPKDKGMEVNPRTGEKKKLLPDVNAALIKAVGLAIKMHQNIGKEIFSIGWDLLIRDDEPVFIEFNINNGFFVADHSIEECEEMIDFYGTQFAKRVGPQLINFDPFEKEGDVQTGTSSKGKKTSIKKKASRAKTPVKKQSAKKSSKKSATKKKSTRARSSGRKKKQ